MTGARKPRSTRVLVVEDVPEFARFLCYSLQNEWPDLDVDVADSLSAALEYIGKREYGEIILDRQLPDSPNGEETFRIVYNAAAPTPIVILTGGLIDDAKLAAYTGAAGIMQKDRFRPSVLLRPLFMAQRLSSDLGRPNRVLLVDDDDTWTELLELLLADKIAQGQLVLEVAHSLAEAREKLVEPCPDAVCLDLRLSDCAGLDTLAAVLELCRDTAVVVMTSSMDPGIEGASIAMGAGAFLRKSDCKSADVLLRAIDRAIIRRQRDRVTQSSGEYFSTLRHAFETIFASVQRLSGPSS